MSSAFGREFGIRHPIPTYSDSIRVASIQDRDWEKVKDSYGQGGSGYSSSSGRTYYGPQQTSTRVYGDYKYVLLWFNQESYVVQPNVKTANGIIHIIDYPFISPSDVVAGAQNQVITKALFFSLLARIMFFHSS